MTLAKWDEEAGLVAASPADAQYDIPDDEWGAYLKVLALASDIEDRMRAQYQCGPQIPPDLAALKGILSDEEILALVALRSGPAVAVAAPSDPLADVPPVEAFVLPNVVEERTCPNHRGAIHVPATYIKLHDTPVTRKVGAICSCGYQFKHPVGCPHREQGRPSNGRSGDIPCSWCGKIIIGNTGAITINDQNLSGSLAEPNPNKYIKD